MLDKIQKKKPHLLWTLQKPMNFRNISWTLSQKSKNKLPSLTAASCNPPASCIPSEAECCTPVRSCWSKFFASDWSWYVGTAEKISHTDFCFYKNENVLEKGNSFQKKVVGWCWFCWTSLWNFQDNFFRSLYQKSAGKGHHIRWAPGNGRDVGRVGQFTPSDALAKTKAISAYDMWVFIGWDWCVFLDPRRFILAIHSESPMQRPIQDSASTQPQRASLCLWCRMAEASRYHVMSWYVISCHLTFQSHHNFHHSTAERCFCEVTPGHSLEQMRSQPCEHLIHQCTKRIPPEASNPALQKMSMIRSKSVHVFCLNFPSHCVIIL